MNARKLRPKVHPLSRTVEPEDPMELMAESVPGDPDIMLACVMQEFAWVGCGADELLGMFRSPGYPVLNQLLDYFGEAEVRRRLTTLLDGSGVFQVRETIAEPDREEEELIQLGIRTD
jgi:hypothetical protein